MWVQLLFVFLVSPFTCQAVPVSFLETQGFDDYFQQSVKEAGGAVRRSVVEIKRLNATVLDQLIDCKIASQSFAKQNADKLSFTGEVVARTERFTSDMRFVPSSYLLWLERSLKRDQIKQANKQTNSGSNNSKSRKNKYCLPFVGMELCFFFF
jgi:hypothetical protein